MALIRSNNPQEWVAVDRVSINETTPPGAITDTGNNYVGFVVGVFERGPVDVVTLVTSSQDFIDKFGGYGSGTYDGYNAVSGKKWGGALYVVRISNSGQDSAVLSLYDAQTTPTKSVECEASSPGLWGNRLRVQAYACSDTTLTNGFALEVTLLASDLVTTQDQEYIDNIVDIDNLPADGTSKYVNFSKASGATTKPDTSASVQALTGGLDGSFTDADYIGAVGDERGLYLLRARKELGIVVAGSVTQTVSTGVKATVAAAQNLIGVVASPTDASVTQVLTDVTSNRNTAGRIIHSYPYVTKYINGSNQNVPGHSDLAAALTRLAAYRDIAGGSNADLFAEILGLSKTLVETDYETLNPKGVCVFEQDDVFGITVRNGVNTSMNSAYQMIFRRRMTDLLTKSIGNRLQFWLGRVNSARNRLAIKAEIENYLRQKVTLEEIEDYLVDVESLNSASSLANGELHIRLQIKLFSSMRFIVLHAEVGERVTVNEV